MGYITNLKHLTWPGVLYEDTSVHDPGQMVNSPLDESRPCSKNYEFVHVPGDRLTPDCDEDHVGWRIKITTLHQGQIYHNDGTKIGGYIGQFGAHYEYNNEYDEDEYDEIDTIESDIN